MSKAGVRDEQIREALLNGTLRVVESGSEPPAFFYDSKLGVIPCKWRWNWRQVQKHTETWGTARTTVCVDKKPVTFYRSRMVMAAEELHLLTFSYDPSTGARHASRGVE